MRFMQIESVLQTKNRSEPAKNRFSVALVSTNIPKKIGIGRLGILFMSAFYMLFQSRIVSLGLIGQKPDVVYLPPPPGGIL